MVDISRELKKMGIVGSEHIGDGAYVGDTSEGMALFTTDGVTITRPVYLDHYAMAVLYERLRRKIDP